MAKKPEAGVKKGEIGPIAITLFAAALWGLSGTASQVLFQTYSFPPFGLVAIRTILSGVVLFALFRPKWPRKDASRLILYAIFGILPTQLFYFITIAYSNIVTALLLEYLSLPMIVIYEGLTGRFSFNGTRMAMILLTVLGILLVVLGGGGALHLSVTPVALVTGILSAVGTAYATLFSRPLTTKYGPWPVIGWSFLIVGLVTVIPGAVALAQMAPIASAHVPIVIGLVLVVAVLGTLIPYGLALRALQKLSGTEVTVIETTEPVWAAIASFFVFGALLSVLQYIGGALMLIAVVILKVISPEGKKREA